jgi:Ala-tRNA(Pro) deacylase
MKDVYDYLDRLQIKYEKHEHPAVFTVEEADKYHVGSLANAMHTKNLFLRNKKGDKHYLVILPAAKKLSIDTLTKDIGETKLSFASPERMMRFLGVTPGAVSPFGLINDQNHEVQAIVDKDLLKGATQGFHPNVNTTTLVVTTADFVKFLESTNNRITYLDLR